MESRKILVIMDTNFLYIPFQFKVDIFSEFARILNAYELAIFDKTFGEISNKAVKALVDSRKDITILKTKISYIDDAIVDYVSKNHDKRTIIVATQDILLKKRLKEFNVSIVTLRSKKHLAFDRKSSHNI